MLTKVLLPLIAAVTPVLATVKGPVINENFPDPGIVKVGGTVYATLERLLHEIS